ncbi:hypothetical protein [Halarchaeum sp. CBA1220]|nr:hypothetical protein [Halarchaeum sp. CBA1220]
MIEAVGTEIVQAYRCDIHVTEIEAGGERFEIIGVEPSGEA